jgi:hypothetical protein
LKEKEKSIAAITAQQLVKSGQLDEQAYLAVAIDTARAITIHELCLDVDPDKWNDDDRYKFVSVLLTQLNRASDTSRKAMFLEATRVYIDGWWRTQHDEWKDFITMTLDMATTKDRSLLINAVPGVLAPLQDDPIIVNEKHIAAVAAILGVSPSDKKMLKEGLSKDIGRTIGVADIIGDGTWRLEELAPTVGEVTDSAAWIVAAAMAGGREMFQDARVRSGMRKYRDHNEPASVISRIDKLVPKYVNPETGEVTGNVTLCTYIITNQEELNRLDKATGEWTDAKMFTKLRRKKK